MTLFMKRLFAACGIAALAGLEAAAAEMWKQPQPVVLRREESWKHVTEHQRGAVEVGYHQWCVPGPGEGATPVSATIMAPVGIKGVRRHQGNIQIVIGFQERPRLLFRGAAPGPCNADFRKRAEKELDLLLKRLEEEPFTVDAQNLVNHLPLGDGQPVKPLVFKKKLTFMGDSKELSFEVAFLKIL
jgi:hypothetical protein